MQNKNHKGAPFDEQAFNPDDPMLAELKKHLDSTPEKVLKEQWESIPECGATINEFMDSQPVHTRSQLIQFGEDVKKACAENYKKYTEHAKWKVVGLDWNPDPLKYILSININDLL